jgi:hypothetical protein
MGTQPSSGPSSGLQDLPDLQGKPQPKSAVKVLKKYDRKIYYLPYIHKNLTENSHDKAKGEQGGVYNILVHRTSTGNFIKGG